MKKLSKRQLRLAVETLRVLDPKEHVLVIGGAAPQGPPTWTCQNCRPEDY